MALASCPSRTDGAFGWPVQDALRALHFKLPRVIPAASIDTLNLMGSTIDSVKIDQISKPLDMAMPRK